MGFWKLKSGSAPTQITRFNFVKSPGASYTKLIQLTDEGGINTGSAPYLCRQCSLQSLYSSLWVVLLF